MNTIISLGARISEIEGLLKVVNNKANERDEEFYESKISILKDDLYNLKIELQKNIFDTINEELKSKIEKLEKQVKRLDREINF